MEFISLANISLDLNGKPLRIIEEEPLPPKQEELNDFIKLGRNITAKEEKGALIEELNRVSAENKKLTELLTVLCENYNELRNRVIYTSKNSIVNNDASRKRKAESGNNNGNTDGINGPSESSSSDEDSSKKPREQHIEPKISRSCVRTEVSDTSLILKDGYQWRKYGQKVTRDNPSPRTYFKCCFAPTCPVKKKVQRSIKDQSILVATYEGEHNHPHPLKPEQASSSSRVVTPSTVPRSTTSLNSSAQTITPDLTKPKPATDSIRIMGTQFQQYLVEQMASTLTQDPNFKSALAAAISGQVLQQNSQAEKL
ncbi:probable WRKY transcription factor 40 [Olea europaea subsp. europaea]|uniref:Probable WRKY transcription factor 40 n=1 Tax=Olea europaea subsp. europaea TaxID=158383 RepID=A0A8S0QA51_OLEEU|nr:probable WRKY transcription factor 40 [Olea europaea subsp. europaea]